MGRAAVLNELKKILLGRFPGRIQRVILYGSRATASARPHSDYDILVVLGENFDWRLEDEILASCYEVDLKCDIVTDVKVISRSDLDTLKGKQPYVLAALASGIRA